MDLFPILMLMIYDAILINLTLIHAVAECRLSSITKKMLIKNLLFRCTLLALIITVG